MAKVDPAEGLDQDDSGVTLHFNEVVKVVSGKHAGKTGRAFHLINSMLEIKIDDVFILVDKDDIDVKFDKSEIKLYLHEDEHAAFDQMCRDYENGDCWS